MVSKRSILWYLCMILIFKFIETIVRDFMALLSTQNLGNIRAGCGTCARHEFGVLLCWSLKSAGNVDLRLPLNFMSWEVLELRGGVEVIGGGREAGRQLKKKKLLNCYTKRVNSFCPRH